MSVKACLLKAALVLYRDRVQFRTAGAPLSRKSSSRNATSSQVPCADRDRHTKHSGSNSRVASRRHWQSEQSIANRMPCTASRFQTRTGRKPGCGQGPTLGQSGHRSHSHRKAHAFRVQSVYVSVSTKRLSSSIILFCRTVELCFVLRALLSTVRRNLRTRRSMVNDGALQTDVCRHRPFCTREMQSFHAAIRNQNSKTETNKTR